MHPLYQPVWHLELGGFESREAHNIAKEWPGSRRLRGARGGRAGRERRWLGGSVTEWPRQETLWQPLAYTRLHATLVDTRAPKLCLLYACLSASRSLDEDCQESFSNR